MELLHLSSAFFFTALIVMGLITGSFLNVVIYRLPIMLDRQWQQESKAVLFPEQRPPPVRTYNLAKPASHCPVCQHKIRPWENIPVISYVLLKGRCAGCKTSIALRYPVIECVTAAITLAIGWQFGTTWETLAYCGLAWSLLVLAMIDLDTQLLPDLITIPLLWSGLIFNALNDSVGLYNALWGAIAGYLSLWSVYWFYKLVSGKDGMGHGDFKLLAALGAWLGWFVLPILVFLSSLVGSVITLGLIVLNQHNRSQPIPFGPYLAAAGFVVLLWGDQINQLYLQLMGIM